MNKIEIDERSYDKKTVFEALYNLSNLAYFFIKEKKEGKFIIEIEKKKDEIELEKIIKKLKEELLNVKMYNINRERNKLAEDVILQGCLNELKNNGNRPRNI